MEKQMKLSPKQKATISVLQGIYNAAKKEHGKKMSPDYVFRSALAESKISGSDIDNLYTMGALLMDSWDYGALQSAGFKF